MGGTTGHLTDLVPLKHHQGRLPVDSGGAIPLLPMIIVSPGKDLETESKDSTCSRCIVIVIKLCKPV